MKCLCTGYKGLLTNFEEKWKPVVGFEGMYEVSDKGSVKSLSRPAWGKVNRLVKEKILTSKISRTGYEITHLRKDGKNCHPSVHRLVAEAFIPNVDLKPTVNHIDGDKLNNNVNNLEWATHKEQSDHAFNSNLIVILLNAYREIVGDVYNGEDRDDEEGNEVQDNAPVFSLKVVD